MIVLAGRAIIKNFFILAVHLAGGAVIAPRTAGLRAQLELKISTGRAARELSKARSPRTSWRTALPVPAVRQDSKSRRVHPLPTGVHMACIVCYKRLFSTLFASHRKPTCLRLAAFQSIPRSPSSIGMFASEAFSQLVVQL